MSQLPCLFRLLLTALLLLGLVCAMAPSVGAQNFFASWGSKPGFSGGYRESFNMGRK